VNPAGGAFLPLLAAATVGVQVGAAMVASRFAVAELDPISLAVLRYGIAFLCLLPPAFMAGPVRWARRDILPVAALGIAQFGILVALLNYALRFVSSGQAALIFSTFPLLAMILAVWLGHERLTVRRTAGVLATILGVACTLADSLTGGASGTAGLWGGFVVLLCAACGAASSVFYRPYLQRYPPVQASAFAMLASVVFLAPVAALAEGFFADLPRVSGATWAAVAFVGLSSGLGTYLWLWALRRTAATSVTVFLALGPVTATALGAMLLGEAVTVALLLGLAAIVLGLWLATRPAPPP
jgi:drug/metabolite transporter (DMT)-like permease